MTSITNDVFDMNATYKGSIKVMVSSLDGYTVGIHLNDGYEGVVTCWITSEQALELAKALLEAAGVEAVLTMRGITSADFDDKGDE